MEDLEDDVEDDEEGGWGVSAVEATPSLPAKKLPTGKEREDQQVSHPSRLIKMMEKQDPATLSVVHCTCPQVFTGCRDTIVCRQKACSRPGSMAR